MANTSRINGFRPVKHSTGAPYNGQANVYFVPASDGTALFVGDPVVLAGDASVGGIATVTKAAASAAFLGVVVGIINAKQDPVQGTLTTGSIALDTPVYRPASTAQYVLVEDSGDVIYEVEGTNGGASYTYLTADIGLNAGYFNGTGSTSTGVSGSSLDVGGTKATTATLPWKILGTVQRVDNESIGGTSTAVKYLVKANNTAMGSGTGATGQ